MDWLYWYSANVVSIYDADTITVDVDMGLSTWQRGIKVRLLGIDAPELRGDEREKALKARDWLRDQILDKDIVINTVKDKSGKYGRLLATVWLGNRCINDELVDLGFAKTREY